MPQNLKHAPQGLWPASGQVPGQPTRCNSPSIHLIELFCPWICYIKVILPSGWSSEPINSTNLPVLTYLYLLPVPTYLYQPSCTNLPVPTRIQNEQGLEDLEVRPPLRNQPGHPQIINLVRCPLSAPSSLLLQAPE